MRAWIRLPSPAMGVALVALVVALGGTSYAVVRIGTKQIKNNAITSAKIRNGQVRNVDLARNSVVTAKILAGAVSGLQLRDASVGNADLANDAVTGAKVRVGTIGSGDLANDAVTGVKIRAGNVGESDLATDAVTSAKIKDGSIATGDYADGSITASKIKDGEVVEGNGRMLSTALTLPDGTGMTTLLSVPGLGALRASCANGVTTTQWQNTTSGAVTAVNQIVLHKTAVPAAGDSDTNVATVAGGATVDQPANSGVGGQESVMWQASDDSSGGDRVSTLWVTAAASGTGCRITAQGLATATP
jgi:trimeric autotransporter adhesin